MQALLEFTLNHPYATMFLGAHYIVYATLAWLVVLMRALGGRFTRREWILLAVFGVALLLEWAELMVDHFKFSGNVTYGLGRYFGTFAPLLWLWAAKALADLWMACASRPAVCRLIQVGLVALLAWMGVEHAVLPLCQVKTDSARYDVECAARAIAPVIKKDYAGPARQTRPNRATSDYFSTRRPVVFSDMSAAAWMVRGQSEGAAQKGCPYPDDYLFVRVGTGYRNIERIDPKRYDFVASVKGSGTLWRLFRRKTTPSRLKTATRGKEGGK